MTAIAEITPERQLEKRSLITNKSPNSDALYRSTDRDKHNVESINISFHSYTRGLRSKLKSKIQFPKYVSSLWITLQFIFENLVRMHTLILLYNVY